MIRRPPRSTRVRSSAASDVYKRQTTAQVDGWCTLYITRAKAASIVAKHRDLPNIHATPIEPSSSEQPQLAFVRDARGSAERSLADRGGLDVARRPERAVDQLVSTRARALGRAGWRPANRADT